VENIIKRIKKLPPLSRTVLDVMEFNNKEEKTSEELIKIIKSDPLLIIFLLKTANSALFGFKNEIETIDNLVNILGVDFTISLVLSQSLQNSFDIDFSPYGIDSNKFRDATILSVNFLQDWVNKIDKNLTSKLLLPIVLFDLGKYLIANEINKQFKTNEFYEDIKQNKFNMDNVERKYCNCTSLEVTVMLLKHWEIGQNIINEFNNSKKIFEVIKTICIVINPLGTDEINNGINKALDYGFNVVFLNDTIQKITLRKNMMELTR